MSYSRNPTTSFNDYFLGLFPSRWPFLGSCPANPMTKWSATWMRQVLRSCSAMPSGDLQQQTLCKGFVRWNKWDVSRRLYMVFLHFIKSSFGMDHCFSDGMATYFGFYRRSCLAHPFRLRVLRYQPWSLSCRGALGACVGDAGSSGGIVPKLAPDMPPPAVPPKRNINSYQ